MIGSKYPDNLDSFAIGDEPKVAATVFNQVAAIVEATQRGLGQGIGDLSNIGNTTDDTFAKQITRLWRVEVGTAVFTSASGSSITASNQGTRELTVTFPTYGGSTVFSNAAKMAVFVFERGGNINSRTIPNVLGGNKRDSGNIVDGSVTTSQFKWRHDQTNFIGNITWIAVQWAE